MISIRKTTIIIFIAFISSYCTNSEKEKYRVFGDPLINQEGVISGKELIKLLNNQDSVHVKIEGKIYEVCSKKGCWMDLDLDEENKLFVKFMDYGFFVPLDAAGSTAIVEGIAKIEVQSIEWLKHKAKDAGKSQSSIDSITEPIISYSIPEATGVIIK